MTLKPGEVYSLRTHHYQIIKYCESYVHLLPLTPAKAKEMIATSQKNSNEREPVEINAQK